MTKRYRQSDLTGKPRTPKEGVETPSVRRGRSWSEKSDDVPRQSKREVSIARTEREKHRKPVINKDREDGLFPWTDVVVIDGCAWKVLTGDVLMSELRKIKDDELDSQQACVARPVRDVEWNEIDWTGFPLQETGA